MFNVSWIIHILKTYIHHGHCLLPRFLVSICTSCRKLKMWDSECHMWRASNLWHPDAESCAWPLIYSFCKVFYFLIKHGEPVKLQHFRWFKSLARLYQLMKAIISEIFRIVKLQIVLEYSIVFQGNISQEAPFDEVIDNAHWVGMMKTNNLSYYLRVSWWPLWFWRKVKVTGTGI